MKVGLFAASNSSPSINSVDRRSWCAMEENANKDDDGGDELLNKHLPAAVSAMSANNSGVLHVTDYPLLECDASI